MPNDCWNHITITCELEDKTGELQSLFVNELQNNTTVEIIKKAKRGIIFDIWSAWNPDYEWLESLLYRYPNCWVKNEWNEEAGNAGVWVGYVVDNKPVVRHLAWEDISVEGNAFLFMDENEGYCEEKM
jgi:hypothetical protein